MSTKRVCRTVLALACAATCATALAQFPQLVTDFQQNGEGVAYPTQKASLGDLQVVVFQDPNQAVVTHGHVRPDSQAIYGLGDPNLPSTEESFVAAFSGFGGANASTQFMDIRFQWLNSADPNRWVLIETLQSPQLGDPSLHLGGKVRMYVNLPNCAQYEFSDPNLGTLTPEIGLALLISETGKNVPQGFQDNAVLSGSFEFVGVSSVADANTAYPIPVPSRFIPITDAFCEGATTAPDGNWRLVEFDLPTENVIGWTYRGGNGVLDATGVGDLVNRGVLAGLVLTVRQTDTTSGYVEFLVDQITFEAPVTDPASAPSIAVPVVAGDTSVQINDVVSRATLVTLEIDRSDPNNQDPFVVDETFTTVPGLDPNTEAHYTTIGVTPALAVGDRLRARQQINADIGPNSIIVAVNPPAAFSATLSLDESGSLGTVANFEWVGATSVVGTSGTQGKPIFPVNGMWQKLEYSLIPGIEPVISFAGGNGLLEPDGGLYNIDAMFFTIDPTSPSVGPYLIYVDHVYYIDPNDNEVLIANAEGINPFPNYRGQSTSVAASITSVLSSATSYDGISSNRLGWTFPDTATSNTHAPYRPAVTFPDSAKAVGMWLLVEDPRTSTLPLPAIEQRVIGVAPAVTVNNIDPNATLVRLFVNGVLSNSVNPAGATSVNIVPGSALALGQQVSANYDVPDARATSDLAYPRVVQPPPAPALPSTLVAGQTTVTVNNVLNTGNAIATQVRVFADGVQIGSANPAGAASVVVSVNPPLALGQLITARQTVNAFESVDSIAVAVGTGVQLKVVINELAYDDYSGDDREFIELYNGEPNAVDISGWKIRASDTVAPPADDNPDFTIPASTTIAAGGFYVIGQAGVPGVNLVIVNNQLENDNEAYELLDQNGVVVDTLITERNKGTVAVSPAEGGIWGNFQSYLDTVTLAPSIGRWFDGYDTNDNGNDFGFRPATPGATNNVPSLAPYTQNFDGGTVGADVPNWGGSFVPLKYMDPATAGTYNPGVIPASPQGGYAGICMDPSGGGNQCVLSDEARYSIAFSCYIYLDLGNPGFVAGNTTDEYQCWSIGIGATDTLENVFPPYPGGTGNGNTGLMWQFLIREDANTGNVLARTLQFVDRNDGGNGSPDGTVLLDVDTNALTTGWYQLSITRNYTNYSASFGSSSVSGTVTDVGPGALSMGYREYVVGFPVTLRPPTIDAVSITVPTPVGACCVSYVCSIMTSADCTAASGSYKGDATTCTDGICACRGDASCDGLISYADINPFVQAISNLSAWQAAHPGCSWQNCDVNGDGVVSFADINPFVQKIGTPGPCP